MTIMNAQKATRTSLVFNDDSLIDIQPMVELAQRALAAFDLAPTATPVVRFDGADIEAGPMAVAITIADGTEAAETARIQVEVRQTRDSETLHPEADAAIAAEIMSLMIERTGGTQVHWGPADIMIPAARFQGAFTPIRLRDPHEMPRITPRRIRPATAAGEPLTQQVLIDAIPANVPLGIEDAARGLHAVFRDDPVAAPVPAPQDPATRGAIWATTATVSVMNPAVGVPLAAYQAICGGNLRISTNAFALTAIFSVLTPAIFGYLPAF